MGIQEDEEAVLHMPREHQKRMEASKQAQQFVLKVYIARIGFMCNAGSNSY